MKGGDFFRVMTMTLLQRVRPIRGLAATTRRSASTTVPTHVASIIESLTATATTTVTANGSSSATGTTNTFDVTNPANPSQVIAQVPVMNQHDAVAAIDRATQALPSWRDGTTAAARAAILSQWSRNLQSCAETVATIMTLESGKPLSESRGEVAYAASFLDYYAAEAVRPGSAGGGFLVPTHAVQAAQEPRGQIMALYQAVGTCAMVSPWNFPAAMITRKVGPAFAAGCTAVVKPSELTPLTALYMQQLAIDAGLPPGVLELVTADTGTTPAVGREFCTNTAVRKISFTGSTAVGKTLMQQSAETVQRLSLELGGNAVFVVFDDADVDQAVQAAAAAKFRNAGQTCVCADRFLVHETVHDEFVEKLTQKVESFVVGDGMDPKTTMGPLITSTAVDRVADKVEQAIQREGAVCVTGGTTLPAIGPNFYSPTILTSVDVKSRIWATETFGPVAAIRSFQTEEEALEIANDSSVGLASYFCTKDLSRAFRFSKGLESGMVGVNEGIISTCVAPFGGVKESGLGREGSPLGISEYLETKYIFMNA